MAQNEVTRPGGERQPLELRSYQTSAIEQLREAYRAGARAPLFQLATGSGKTLVFAQCTRSAWSRGRRVGIVVHRRELRRQASEKLQFAGVPHGIIAAGCTPDPAAAVQVLSIQTAIRRLERIGAFDLIVIDEAHHAVAGSWRRLVEAQPQARLLGVTATPARLDGKGLGVHCGGLFDALVCGPPITDLVAGGWLSPARYFAPPERFSLAGVRRRAGDFRIEDVAARVDQKVVTGDAVEQYRCRADHRPAIAFCATVEHAQHVTEEFAAAGYRAAAVHGDLPTPKRDRLIGGLATGEIEVLASCDLISEGLDVPALGCVILLRPTASLVLHMQQIGRGMRPAAGKTDVMVLDHAGNIRRHGRPDFERVWSLDGADKGAAPVKICPECEAANPIAARECEECGFEFPIAGGGRRRAPERVAGYLEELSAERLAALGRMPYRQVVNLRLTEAELRAIAAMRGYKRGWVWHQMRAQRARLTGARQ